MMQQYQAIKSNHRDTILFFRLGDFYEMFEQDAQEASSLLDITLTQRNGVPMCGIPYHAAPGYLARLLKAGKKIAICEQTHIPQAGQGIARREVVEIITPGTIVDENLLDRTENNYLVCIGRVDDDITFSFIDLSTGNFQSTHFPFDQRETCLKQELLRLAPSEVLVQESLFEEDPVLEKLLSEREGTVINRYPDWSFNLNSNRTRLLEQLDTSNLKGYGLSDQAPEIASAGVILDYVSDTSRSMLTHIRDLKIYSGHSYLGLDESTQKNLEIVRNLNDQSKRFTLLEVLDQTRSALGARKLKSWLLQPLINLTDIDERLDRVEFFYTNQLLLTETREHLAKMFDLERLSSRIAMGKAHAKDLLAVKMSLQQVLSICTSLDTYQEMHIMLKDIKSQYRAVNTLVELLDQAICDEPSILLSEGNLVKEGYNLELDRLRKIKENARGLLREYLEEERKKTGISSLKLKYNRIIGHFIEVTKANMKFVPEYYIRRQTLVNGERFTTEALSRFESEINNASEKIIELEREIFLKIREQVREQIALILSICHFISDLDVLQSFAFSATVQGYSRPILHDGVGLHIEEGRHPVVEANLPGGAFIPNSIDLGEQKSFLLLTGPNMAGKSTYLRQIALIVLMAQIGSFVPAGEAVIGVVDRIYCRVGATDNLARGESTFLVEMNETANILRTSSDRSLIIMDEVGRGTSTNDGLAIAWAVSEYILNTVRAKTLFATHFHELTTLKHDKLTNWSMAVLEQDGGIVFLKQVKEGPIDNSYGIHVARLAGIPEEVIKKAQVILMGLEKKKFDTEIQEMTPVQSLLFSPLEMIKDDLLSLNLNQITPLEALNRIAAWQKELEGEDKK